MESLTTTQMNDIVPNNEEKPAKKDVVIFGFDEEQCDVVFIFGETTNVSLHCPSTFLNRISKEFQNNMLETDGGSHYEIKAEGFGVDALTKVLSFYQPKYFQDFKDSDDFRELLTVCSKFQLKNVKTDIQSYLMKKHKLIVDQHFIRVDHYQFLQLAKDFGLNTLFNKIMGWRVESMFTRDIAKSDAFVGISANLKYEIMKKCIRHVTDKLDHDNKQHISGIDLEVISILHFLDLFLYENKILDYALYSKDVVDSPITSNPLKYDSSSFFRKKEDHDVVLKLEGTTELFVNSTVLTDNSPVFKAMLHSTFKEGLENVIELPGKRTEDIIELLESLIYGKKTEYDAFKLLPLCREYQIDWLQDLIQDQLLKLQLPSDRLRLKYLKLSNNMGFLKGELYFVNSLCESFIKLQRYKEFSDLKDEVKLMVAFRRLWFVYYYVKRSIHSILVTCLFHKKLGFPRVFKNVKILSFSPNATEMDILNSLN